MIAGNLTFKITTGNVRTMLLKGKLKNKSSEMKRMEVNILEISEARWKGADSTHSYGFSVLYLEGDHLESGVVLSSIRQQMT